jgi:hypothetical protein
LGFHVLRVRFLAWLTLFPVIVCFPHSSQIRDIFSFLKTPFLAVDLFITKIKNYVKRALVKEFEKHLHC